MYVFVWSENNQSPKFEILLTLKYPSTFWMLQDKIDSIVIIFINFIYMWRYVISIIVSYYMKIKTRQFPKFEAFFDERYCLVSRILPT